MKIIGGGLSSPSPPPDNYGPAELSVGEKYFQYLGMEVDIFITKLYNIYNIHI